MADIVEQAAYSVISQLLDIPVIYADQNKPRPKRPYAIIKVNSRLTLGSDDRSAVDESGVMTLRGQREGVVMVNVFADTAGEICDDLVNATRKVTSRYLMRRESFWLNADAGVNNITALRDSANFETMANVDFSFRYTGQFTDNVGLIEVVDTTGSTIGDLPVNEIINLN